jgi:hypothetical protein
VFCFGLPVLLNLYQTLSQSQLKSNYRTYGSFSVPSPLPKFRRQERKANFVSLAERHTPDNYLSYLNLIAPNSPRYFCLANLRSLTGMSRANFVSLAQDQSGLWAIAGLQEPKHYRTLLFQKRLQILSSYLLKP